MKQSYSMLFAAMAAFALGIGTANAETVDGEIVYDFSDYEIGQPGYAQGSGNPCPDQTVVTEDPFNGGYGNVMKVYKENWDSRPRIHELNCPKGFTFANCTLIEVAFYNAAEEPAPLSIQFKTPGTSWVSNYSADYLYELDPDEEIGEWAVAYIDPAEITAEDGSEPKDLLASSSFGLAYGFFLNPTEYYIGEIKLYFDKEVTQREIDEDALDKNTAACVTVDFDNWEVSAEVDGAFSSPHLGSNGGGVNRRDMVIDLGPEGYNNNCAHIIYQGWTQIFLVDPIVAPEGYTCDDIRLIEYDIYESTLPGEDMNNPGTLVDSRNGAPQLKIKEWYAWGWEPLGNGGSFGNTQLPSVDEWNHVEFYPSAFTFPSRTFDQDKLDENGDRIETGEVDDEGNPIYEKESITWDPDQAREEFGKLKQFNMSIGFFPCLAQTWVDNVKVWYQKTTAGIDNIIADKAEVESNTATVYNLQGVCVLKNAAKDAVSNLPAGLYIVNGKKVVIK